MDAESTTELPSFPAARQAQIIRANQRDLFQVSLLQQDADTVVRSWLGTRFLLRWEKELDLLVKLVYYGLTTGRAMQTLGEEYTDIWQHTSDPRHPLSFRHRLLLILVPALPSFVVARYGGGVLGPVQQIANALEVLAEVNLAIFYLKGIYYDLVRRVLGIKYLSSIPENPHSRPPSYSLLGVLLATRLLHRLVSFIRETAPSAVDVATALNSTDGSQAKHSESFLDSTPVSTIISQKLDDSEAQAVKSAEEDTHTALSMASIPLSRRSGRKCTLCLDERTESTVTECGHLFCWSCIVGWGREKAECPLCRQELLLTRLVPIYNL